MPAVVDLATMREAMAELGGDAGRINPLIPAELVIDHSVIADVFGRPDAFERNVEFEYPAQRRAVRLPALGPGGAAPVQGRAAGHRDRAPGQHRAPGPGDHDAGRGGGRRGAGRLPGHLPRHRLAHHHAERARRAGLGRRRHRGRGGHARPAGLDADPAGDRVPADRGAPGRGDRHRPGAHDHRAAAQARRGRQVRRVLRRGRGRRAGGQPGHDRQHEPGVRLYLRDLPHRRGDPRLPAADRAQRRARRARRGVRQGTGPVARPGAARRATPRNSSSTWPPWSRRWPAPSGRRTGWR